MPILPLIDLLILMSTASLLVGFVLKAISLATRYHPTVLGFSSMDFVTITGICLGLALVLAARTWVKLNEPRLLGAARSYRGRRRAPVADVGLEDDSGELPVASGAARASDPH